MNQSQGYPAYFSGTVTKKAYKNGENLSYQTPIIIGVLARVRNSILTFNQSSATGYRL